MSEESNPGATFGYVYVVTNPGMPGLVKIGKTTLDDVQTRLAQLYTASGVPFPFKLEFAGRVEDPTRVEQALHTAFGPQRVNPKREFFSIEAGQAIAILKLLHTDDQTEAIASRPVEGVEQSDIAAGEQFRTRRPSLDFNALLIPTGSELISTKDPTLIAVVVGPRRVRFGDAEMSITAATRQALGLSYSVGPAPYWTYAGRLLRDIYNDAYPFDGQE